MRITAAWLLVSSLILPVSAMAQNPKSFVPEVKPGCVRIATFNVSLHRKRGGELVENLQSGDDQARKLAEIVRMVAPDILLVNELDYDPQEASAKLLLEKYFQSAQSDEGKRLLHYFTADVNTGKPSKLDLNKNGKLDEPDDAWGFGLYPGQYGMAVYSRFPIQRDQARTFQNFLWRDMPGALIPKQPSDGLPFYSDEIWAKFPLSSKSHWDVPIETELGVVHILASHPTPPVFDGREDRNGSRNHDEIRFWRDYVSGDDSGKYIYDDQGAKGGLKSEDLFVVVGDLNADPFDGDGNAKGIRSLLESKRVNSQQVPASRGAVEASREQGKANANHKGPAETDTADFGDGSAGNLRCDFALPSNQFEIVQSGVFWPTNSELENAAELLGTSDHRLVWIDVRIVQNK
jgi:hypothetical protein